MRMRRRREVWGGDEEPAAPSASLLGKEKRQKDGREEQKRGRRFIEARNEMKAGERR